MSLLIAIILGIAVGTSVDYFLHGSFYNFLLNSVVGAGGSIIGLAIYFFFLEPDQTGHGFFSAQGSLCSIIGALITGLIANALEATAPRRVHQSHIEKAPLDKE